MQTPSPKVAPENSLIEENTNSIFSSPPGSPQASPLRPASPTEEPQELSAVSNEAVFNSTGDIDYGALSLDQFRSNSSQDAPKETPIEENTVVASAPKARRSSSYVDPNDAELASIEHVLKDAQQLLKLLTPPYAAYSRLLIQTIDTYLKLFVSGSMDLKSSNGKKTASSFLQRIQKNMPNIRNYFREENPLDRLVTVQRALVDAAKDNLKKTIVDELIEILNDTVHEVIEKTPPELKLRSLEVLSQFYSKLITVYPNELQKFHEMLSYAVQQELEKNTRELALVQELPSHLSDIGDREVDIEQLKREANKLEQAYKESSHTLINRLEWKNFDKSYQTRIQEQESDLKFALESSSKKLQAKVPALENYGKVLKKINKLHKKMISNEAARVSQNREAEEIVKKTGELEHNLNRLEQIIQVLESQ